MRTPARILIADDNPDNLEIFRTRLATQGYEILVAVDGEEALSLAREHTPDLLLLDVMMPKMDGVDVCRNIKAEPLTTVHSDHNNHREERALRTSLLLSTQEPTNI